MTPSFVALASLLLFGCCSSANYNYYVSPDGSDSNGDGSSSKPWATIQTAQKNVQKLIGTLSKNSYVGNITVNIESGAYHGPLTFGIQDSMQGFANNNYVIYQSMNDSNLPFIYGAYNVTSSWTKVSTQNGLTLYKTNLKSQESDLPSNGDIYEIYMNGDRISPSKSSLLTYDNLDVTTKTITTNDKMIPNIKNIISSNYSENMLVLVYEHWTSSYHKVKSIQYTASSGKIYIILSTGPTQWVNDAASGKRFYLLNNMNLLTMNGQFYFNQTTLDLYLLINSTINNQVFVTFAKDIEIITMKGASTSSKIERMVFNNLHLRYSAIDVKDCFDGSCMAQSAAMLSTATLHTINVDNIIFHDIKISDTGGYAVWLDQGTTNTQIINSHFKSLGAGGIRIGVNAGGNVAQTSLASNILVSHNKIEGGGNVYESGCGILAQSFAYTNITNNLIKKFKYTGISTGWTWDYETTTVSNNIVARNMIGEIGQYILSDMGCIYTLGEQQNCLYDNNICHDVYSYNYGGWGYYTDQASRFLTWTNNIAYNTKCAGHHQHFGLDNIFLNNIYAFNELDEGQHDGAVRSSQHAGTCNYKSNQGACSSFTFITNIVYTNNTWGYDILGDSSKTLWKNMTLDGNTYWSVKQHSNITFPDDYTIQKWVNEGKDVQHAIADPMFVDPENHNFNLKLGSPAIALGFHQINTEDVGPNW